ncbi:hypothetical protein MOD48_11855 [Bacillus spizizenii]|nr:hypothetical protein [Bacillus spizizenii]MCY8632026.1 hypothetical protein [Bacillus spizizenii]MCY8692038.1 hypothetical protein [Bacillus spizizenii]
MLRRKRQGKRVAEDSSLLIEEKNVSGILTNENSKLTAINMLTGVINSYFWLAPCPKPKVSCQTGCATDKEQASEGIFR